MLSVCFDRASRVVNYLKLGLFSMPMRIMVVVFHFFCDLGGSIGVRGGRVVDWFLISSKKIHQFSILSQCLLGCTLLLWWNVHYWSPNEFLMISLNDGGETLSES